MRQNAYLQISFERHRLNCKILRENVENQALIGQKERRKCQHPVRGTVFSG